MKKKHSLAPLTIIPLSNGMNIHLCLELVDLLLVYLTGKN